MRINVSSYIPGTSPIHACDARVKIVLLAMYSVTLFLVDMWAGLVLCGALFAAAAIACALMVGVVYKRHGRALAAASTETP